MKKDKKSQLLLKVELYIMSLWLLFVLIFLLTIDIPISFAPGATFIGWFSLLSRNLLPIISLFFILWSMLLAKKIQFKGKGVTNPGYEVISVKNENYEYLTFLTTYIIPLVCIDLKSVRYVIVLVVLLVLIGYIFIKMDLYYGNPTLALLGYRLYRIKVNRPDNSNDIVVLSQNRLVTGAYIEWIVIDENFWVVKEINNDNS